MSLGNGGAKSCKKLGQLERRGDDADTSPSRDASPVARYAATNSAHPTETQAHGRQWLRGRWY